MKNIAFLLVAVCCFVFSSCDKLDFDKKFDDKSDWEFACNVGACPACTDTSFEHPDLADQSLTVYILEPLVYDESCACIVSGFVKYVSKSEGTLALVTYGDGTCDRYGIKTLCVNGKCEGPLVTTCEFEMECGEG